jgi:5,10-methenyltetrahydrofolate synthetase
MAPDLRDADPEQAREVARWRRAERLRLRAERDALGVDARQRVGLALAGHLRAVLAARPDLRVLSGYWPIKGEPDLRPLLADLHGAGLTIALPVVEVRAAPLVFRRWTPGMRMVRGDWNIPVPPPEAEALLPDAALAPLVGWDDAAYRLGYGGGYFDRTLAALVPRPFVIGVGFQAARLATILPQPHDIPLDVIVTEAGVQVTRPRASGDGSRVERGAGRA